jgi:hypothetical protein
MADAPTWCDVRDLVAYGCKADGAVDIVEGPTLTVADMVGRLANLCLEK